jgi:hypothetical protein
MAETRLPQTLGERLSSLNLAEQLATITTRPAKRVTRALVL